MRKSALMLAVLMVAAAPATALAAKKQTQTDPNANSRKFIASAWQQPVNIWKGIWAPFTAQPAKAKTQAKKK